MPRQAARRDRMLDPSFWRLDAEQSAAFLADDPCLIVAGPGSGKTRLMVAKLIRHAIQDGPESVLAVSFSRASAVEFRERLETALAKTAAKRIRVNTFSALAGSQLKAERNHPLATRVLLDEQSSRDMLRRAAFEAKVAPADLESVTEAVARLKCASLEPDATAGADVLHVLRCYQAMLSEANAIDLTDLVRETVLAMRAGTIKPYHVKHLLVDEGQDLDRVQLEWLMAHVDAGARITVVADEDQSIYAFRAALGYVGLTEFVERAMARTVHLVRNYRSAPEIVDAAALVIEDNTERFDKRIVATRPPGGRVNLHTHPDEETQASRVADEVAKLAAAGKTVALVARTNIELDLPEAALLALEVPVRRLGGQSFLQRDYVRRFLSVLALANEHADAEARFLSACELLPLRREAIATIGRHVGARRKGDTPLDAAFDSSLFAGLSRQDGTVLRAWRDDVVTYIAAVQSADARALSTVIREHLERLASHVHDTAHRRGCLFVGRLVARQRAPSVRARVEVLERKQDGSAHQVTLVTAHGSKGLEFDAVWVLNCNDGKFPATAAHEQEERRLFYVAMTRAREQLVFSRLTRGAPSLFVRGLGAKLDARSVAAPPSAASSPGAVNCDPQSVPAPPSGSLLNDEVMGCPVEPLQQSLDGFGQARPHRQRRHRVDLAHAALRAEG
jgi:superfamily I DNA/RNA helicase